MSNNTTAVTGTASADPFDDPVTSNKMAIRALIPLLITFVLGTLCLQGFNLVHHRRFLPALAVDLRLRQFQ